MAKEITKGELLEKVRQNIGFSKTEFVKLLDISVASYNRYLRGENKVPKKVLQGLEGLVALEQREGVKLSGKIDYLRIRFKTLDWYRVVSEILKLQDKPFLKEEFGRYGYDNYFVFGHINVYCSETDSNMGVLVELTGQGCREFEWYMEKEQHGRTWEEFLSDCLGFSDLATGDRENPVKITRIDIALDEFYKKEGNYDLVSLKVKNDEGLIKRKADRLGFITGENNTGSDGYSVYFGSGSSEVTLNFYEKDYEQAKKLGLPVEEVRSLYGFKNRYEVRLSSNTSDRFVKDWIKFGGDVAQKAVGIINDKVHVYNVLDGQLVLDSEWYSLMGSLQAVKFITQPKYTEIGEAQYRWYEKSVAPTKRYLDDLEKITGRGRLAEIDRDAVIPDRKLPELRYVAELHGVSYE